MPKVKKETTTTSAPTSTKSNTISDELKLERLSNIFERLEEVPESWLVLKKRGGGTASAEATELKCVQCTDYKELVEHWEKALKWTDGLDVALSSMLACVTSTMALGDQLWMKIVGPPSCGKSTLCEALSVNKKYVFSKSTIRGFHSGFGDAKEDNSLLKRVQDKTLVVKDGDTILKSPNLSGILSEARDIYDRVSRTHYRNKAGRDYEGVNLTWILCGTSSLRSIDQSELGERFLDCVIMEGIDEEFEDSVLEMAVMRSMRDASFQSNGSVDTRYSPELRAAMELTGGYINHLRENAKDLVDNVAEPQWALRRCARLGKFVAIIRARPSKLQAETAERELGARLASQLARYSKFTAAVLNREEIDDEVIRRTTKIALDTARGQTLEIVELLYHAHFNNGLSSYQISGYTNRTPTECGKMLRFLAKIDAVEHFKWKTRTKQGTVTQKPRWRLTPLMYKLYKDVYGLED